MDRLRRARRQSQTRTRSSLPIFTMSSLTSLHLQKFAPRQNRLSKRNLPSYFHRREAPFISLTAAFEPRAKGHSQSILPVQNTELKFSGPLATRKIKGTANSCLATHPPWQPHPPRACQLLRGGVAGRQGAIHIFNQQLSRHRPVWLRRQQYRSSGRGASAPDRIHAPAAGRSTTWGIATYFWGNDAFDSKPGQHNP